MICSTLSLNRSGTRSMNELHSGPESSSFLLSSTAQGHQSEGQNWGCEFLRGQCLKNKGIADSLRQGDNKVQTG